MGAKTLGTLAGTASGTVVSEVSDEYEAYEILVRANSGSGTVTLSLDTLDAQGSAYTTGVSVVHAGSGTSKGTSYVPAGGVPTGFGAQLRGSVNGTINYNATLIARL